MAQRDTRIPGCLEPRSERAGRGDGGTAPETGRTVLGVRREEDPEELAHRIGMQARERELRRKGMENGLLQREMWESMRS